jgi:D-alanyl-D-alanine carboxypeptidase
MAAGPAGCDGWIVSTLASRRRAVWPAAAVVAVAAVAIAILPLHAPPERPAPQQRVLAGLVAGHVAPGVSAYVVGPHGTWTGAAGVADVATGEPMRAGSRLRLESVSKLWTAVVILRLVEDGRLRLDDSVARRLPGVLPYGDRITVRQLLNHTSGMVDSNDISAVPTRYLEQVKDPALHKRLIAISARLDKDPGYQFSPRVWVDFAAALPLSYPPGTTYHYSNIGYTVAGMVAERAGGAPMATLVREQIAGPLGLRSVAYDPNGEIAGPHARGYRVEGRGKLSDATTATVGTGAGGGIVADAADEARFLQALMQGRIIGRRLLAELKTPSAFMSYGLGTGISPSGCGGTVYTHNGGGFGYESNVFVSGDGRRVAVLLLNGRTADNHGDDVAFAAMQRLYCAG